jgi:outer membrane immunogenic protein
MCSFNGMMYFHEPLWPASYRSCIGAMVLLAALGTIIRNGHVLMCKILSRSLLPCAAIVALTTITQASAADLPMKAPAVAPIPFTWTGCHIGAHLGGAVSDDRTTSALGASVDFSSTGFTGGGQIGCDYQFAPNWVVGFEGQAAWTDLKNTHRASVRNFATGIVVPSQFTLSNDFLASATARLGYSFVDHWLFYAKGGAAWTHEKVDDAFVAPLLLLAVDPSATKTRNGWTVGAGTEWAFAPHWSANVEYNYYDFGNGGMTLVQPGATVTVNSLKDAIHTVTTGVNYHF